MKNLFAVVACICVFFISSCTQATGEAPSSVAGIVTPERFEDALLALHLSEARVVFWGKVLYTVPVEYVKRKTGDPDWQWAVIEVKQVLKGNDRKAIAVLFSGSTSGKWIRSPKFKKGFEGIWALPPAETQQFDTATSASAFMAITPKDVFPTAYLLYIERLLRQ